MCRQKQLDHTDQRAVRVLPGPAQGRERREGRPVPTAGEGSAGPGHTCRGSLALRALVTPFSSGSRLFQRFRSQEHASQTYFLGKIINTMKALPARGPTAVRHDSEKPELWPWHRAGTGPWTLPGGLCGAAVGASLPAQARCPVGLGHLGWRGSREAAAPRPQLWVLPSRQGSGAAHTASSPPAREPLGAGLVLGHHLCTRGSSWSGCLWFCQSTTRHTGGQASVPAKSRIKECVRLGFGVPCL